VLDRHLYLSNIAEIPMPEIEAGKIAQKAMPKRRSLPVK
jgi:hypothetical protein